MAMFRRGNCEFYYGQFIQSLRDISMARSSFAFLVSIWASISFAHYCPRQFDTEPMDSPSYSVKLGDSLWNITARAGHSNSHWPILARANPHVCNPDLIFPGNRLILPKDWVIIDSSPDETDLSKSEDPNNPLLDKLSNNPLVAKALEEFKQITDGSCEVVLDSKDTIAEIADKYGAEFARDTLKLGLMNRSKVESFFRCEAKNSGKVQMISDAQSSQEEKEKTIAVLFVNGVDNMHFEAKGSIEILEKALKEMDQSKAKNIQFGLAYNTTNGIINDLIEVFFQKSDEHIRRTNSADNFDTNAGWSRMLGLEGSAEDAGKKKADFTARLLKGFSENILPELQNEQREQLQEYRKLIKEISCGVVVVAHSQGNLFSNWAYQQLDSLTEQPHVSVISVASPTAQTADSHDCSSDTGFAHFTNGPASANDNDFLSGDIVIGLLHKAAVGLSRQFDPPLCRNIPHPTDAEDRLGHSFKDAYLGLGDPAREILLKKIFSEVERLRSVASDECNIYETVPIKPESGYSMTEKMWVVSAILIIFVAISSWLLYRRRKRSLQESGILS